MSYTTQVVSIGTLNVEPGSGYAATLVQSFVQPESTVSRVQRDADSPIVTNVAPGINQYALTVLVLASGVDADTLDARRRALMGALDTTVAPTTVVIRNQTGTARQRYMRVVVVKTDQVEGQAGSGFAAVVEPADDVRWRSTTTETVTWTFSESGGQSLTVLGDLETYPVITIEPTSAKVAGNWVYRRLVIVKWQSPLGGEHAIDVTGGGLNTTSLQSAGKVTDSSNMAVMMDGRYVPYHLAAQDGQPGGFASTTTRMWTTMTFAPAVPVIVADYVSETDTTIRVRNDGNLPASGYLEVNGAEYISYASRAPGTLYGVKRALFGSVAGVATAGDEMEVVRVGYILYGPDAEIPATHQNLGISLTPTPMIVNNESSNTTWVFTDFKTAGLVSAAWGWEVLRGGGTAFVKESAATGAYATEWTYPWTAIGLRPGWATTSAFVLRTAVPIRTMRVQGRRYAAASPATYPGSAKLTLTDDGGNTRRQVWDSGNGAGRTPNPTFDVTTEDLAAGDDPPELNRVVWGFQGTNFVQADIQKAYVTFMDAYKPVVTVGSEETDYDLDLLIEHDQLNERLYVEYPNMVPGQAVVIDCRRMTAVHSTTGQNLFNAVRRTSLRPYFLKLVPGTNTLLVSEEGMGDVDVTVAYEPRWYT